MRSSSRRLWRALRCRKRTSSMRSSISEDCSTDRTREIVLDFQKEHPEKVRLLLSKQNIHSNEIVVRGIRAARGQYIALLDGDDYWTSPHKLQKQTDFLDSHPECSLCFHNARIFHEAEGREGRNWTPAGQKEIFNPGRYLDGQFYCYLFHHVSERADRRDPLMVQRFFSDHRLAAAHLECGARQDRLYR